MGRLYLNPSELPAPIGPFSYGVLDDGTVYVSGAVGVDEKWNVVGKGDVAVQTERAFQTIQKVLKSGGCSLDDVIKINVFLVGAADYKSMNEVRKRMFRGPYPASTVVVVKELVLPDLLVEIDVIAKRPDQK